MKVEFDRPLSLARSIARYTRWGPDPMNVVVGDVFHRVITVDGELVAYRARQISPATVEIDGPPGAEPELRWRLASALPWEPLDILAADDRRVADLVERRAGYRPPMEVDPYETLVQAVTAQQVNLNWAVTTRRRLVETFGTPIEAFGMRLFGFPPPDRLATVQPGDIRNLQFTWRKAEYIIGVAEAARGGAFDGLANLDNDAVVRALTAVRGIGRWSADWVLGRCLGRPDAVAAGDLAVRKAVAFHWLSSDEIVAESEVREVALAWGDAANWMVHLLLEELTDPLD